MKLNGVEVKAPHFIAEGEVAAFIEKFLVTDKDGTGHLPVDDARHMGAAWAALHGGYRGNKYSGPDKAKAIAKLKALYKSRGMDTPKESAITGGLFVEEGLAKDDSYDSLRCKVECAINCNIRLGIDMDCDDDGEQDAQEGKYAWVCDLFPQVAIYSMEGCLFQIGYAMDADGDIHLSDPEPVQLEYAPKSPSMHSEESFRESYALIAEGDGAGDSIPITVIKPGWSMNNRYYSPEMLKRDFKVFEGAKMFANHQTEAEQKARPEGDLKDWVANLSGVFAESDGTVRGVAAFVDPQFKEKVNLLRKQGLISQLGVSIRAMGEASDGEIAGKRGKIVEALHGARSVDFVTFAGAGGKAE